MREIVLDTETTGLDPLSDHCVVEIGAVELLDHAPTGRTFHRYLNAERNVPADAVAVHGLPGEFLGDKPDDAWRCIGEAMMTMPTTKETWWEAEVYRTGGEIALLEPNPDADKAQAYFERALAVAHQQHAKSWELRAAMSMARLRHGQGKRQAGYDLLAPVYGWFTEGFDTRDLKEAKALLDTLAS
jgi:hypothetical protein